MMFGMVAYLVFHGSKLKTSSCIRLLHCPTYFSLRTLKVTYSSVGISMVKPPLPAKSWTSSFFFHLSHFFFYVFPSHGFSHQPGHSFPERDPSADRRIRRGELRGHRAHDGPSATWWRDRSLRDSPHRPDILVEPGGTTWGKPWISMGNFHGTFPWEQIWLENMDGMFLINWC